jgi:hypothetical protein
MDGAVQDSLLHLLNAVADLAFALGGGVAMLLLLLWLTQRFPNRGRWKGFDGAEMPPPEPGWTESLGADGAHVYDRGQSFNEALMEQDARGQRGEFGTGGGG